MIITFENIHEAHTDTLRKVYTYDYYVDILNEVITDKGEPKTPQEIVSFWSSFWFALPDSKSIRRDPFYQICDIAENITNEEFMGTEE